MYILNNFHCRPDFSFREHIESGEPGHLSLRKPKMIMKRSVNSLDDREVIHYLGTKHG